MDSNTFLVIAIIAIAAQSFLLFLALFEPGLNYKTTSEPAMPFMLSTLKSNNFS